ncbi:hypothetical protein BDZ94DRAFT_1305568 [Collybia nuda]|uniref:Uncharacterized protein n=1 Tax=Collybia nuda TaxID=64659 RepID=A0A9P5YDW1_9AGAR|nr:hypothetical protein BDZ94DRAFT_1305568 [Collybia nuda]
MDLKNKANDVLELSNCPTPANGVIKKLRVSDEIWALMQSQAQTLGVDYRKFGRTQAEQDEAFEFLTELEVHIPVEIERDA